MGAPRIDSYRFGQVVVDGQTYTGDLVVLPRRVLGNWWRQEGHTLQPDDLKSVLEAAPEALVVGQGAFGRMQVSEQTVQALESAGIELIAQPTAQACDTYNALRESRLVAAALHLTC